MEKDELCCHNALCVYVCVRACVRARARAYPCLKFVYLLQGVFLSSNTNWCKLLNETGIMSLILGGIC
jgi:hypothetical protein